jgi:hypothetical protein
MGNAMRKRRYIVEPTADVQAALGGELPGSLEDVAAFIYSDPSLLQHVSISQQAWDARDLTPGARKVVAALLEDENSLDQFLASPDTFVEEYSDGTILIEEIGALTLAGGSMEELVREGFNQVELGASTLGDSDAFILIGFERESGRPNAEGLAWFQEQLDAFARSSTWKQKGMRSSIRRMAVRSMNHCQDALKGQPMRNSRSLVPHNVS